MLCHGWRGVGVGLERRRVCVCVCVCVKKGGRKGGREKGGIGAPTWTNFECVASSGPRTHARTLVVQHSTVVGP